MKIFDDYLIQLKVNELSKRTIVRYKTDIQQFLTWANVSTDEEILQVKKSILIDYKEYLQKTFKPNSTNVKIIGINKFFESLGKGDLKLKQQKLQTKSSLENVLSVSDYERMLRYAEKLDKPMMLVLMKTLAQTGIRIGELKYITVETIKTGRAAVTNKGKTRTIIIPKKLCKELKAYCIDQGIEEGIIFIGKGVNVIDTSYLHKQFKEIAGAARIKKDRAHAHSFRHLFAKEFLSKHNDITLLADLLGHSTLETTRIYTKRSTTEQKKILDDLDLF